MLTNVIAYLHTTFAYQSAAMQLMVAQANFEAQQLHLRETLPIVAPADTNAWRVAMPPDGVGGAFASSNYVFKFNAGKLVTIQRKLAARGAAPDPAEHQPSLIDTNGAYQLARQWLSALSVDMDALEQKYPHRVVEMTARTTVARDRARSRPGATNRPPEHATATDKTPTASPVFRLTWGGRSAGSPPVSAPLQITMEILGSTKQCLGLQIQNPDLLKSPPLQVANAAKLLGPTPTPQQFVEEWLGGPAAYQTVAKPDLVAAWLLNSQADQPDNRTSRTAAISVDAATAANLSRTLTDFNSYSWMEEKACQPDYQAGVRFSKGADRVEFLLCFDCDHLLVSHNGRSAEKDFDGGHVALLQAIQAVFPQDGVVKNLSRLSSQPK